MVLKLFVRNYCLLTAPVAASFAAKRQWPGGAITNRKTYGKSNFCMAGFFLI
jgi:hypothetical protein